MIRTRSLRRLRRRLRRHVRHRASDVELPAVIDAAQRRNPRLRAEDQRRAAMRAGLVDQPDAAFGVAEGDQILAKQADALRLPVLGEIRRRQERNPVQPKQVAERRAFADPHQAFIVFAREHGLPPSIAGGRTGRIAQQRGDAVGQAEILCGPKRIGCGERLAWNGRLLALLRRPRSTRCAVARAL